MMRTACVILAAGLGTRMKSRLPKVLHQVCGVPMLQYVIGTARKIRPEKIIVVAGKHIKLMKSSVDAEDVSFELQREAKGTGHALLCARRGLKNFRGVVVVLNGDTPLVSPETLRKLLSRHKKNADDLSVVSFIAGDPGSYGRILRDESGHMTSIIEKKDAVGVQKKINEVNSGMYAFSQRALSLVDGIPVNRRKGEYYLTDIVELSLSKGLRTSAYCLGSEQEFIGVNTQDELSRASRLMQDRIIRKWIGRGVNFLDPGSVFIHPEASLGKGTTVYPGVLIEGHTRVREGVAIYPNVRISNSIVGESATVRDSTVIEDSTIKSGASVGPFAHVRPGSVVGAGAKIGNFVELKKAVIGKKSKASHLSYLGDARIGNGVNIGAGTITCNYDGRNKHLTVIDSGVFVGSDSQLVAPVRIGKNAYIAAGSTITKNVPAGSLAVSRVKQKNVPGWKKKKIAEGNNEPAGRKKRD